jgi:hypothetical protein
MSGCSGQLVTIILRKPPGTTFRRIPIFLLAVSAQTILSAWPCGGGTPQPPPGHVSKQLPFALRSSALAPSCAAASRPQRTKPRIIPAPAVQSVGGLGNAGTSPSRNIKRPSVVARKGAPTCFPAVAFAPAPYSRYQSNVCRHRAAKARKRLREPLRYKGGKRVRALTAVIDTSCIYLRRQARPSVNRCNRYFLHLPQLQPSEEPQL